MKQTKDLTHSTDPVKCSGPAAKSGTGQEQRGDQLSAIGSPTDSTIQPSVTITLEPDASDASDAPVCLWCALPLSDHPEHDPYCSILCAVQAETDSELP